MNDTANRVWNENHPQSLILYYNIIDLLSPLTIDCGTYSVGNQLDISRHWIILSRT